MILLILTIGSLGFIFLSFFVSSLVKNEGHLSMTTNIIMIPMFLCSNAFYSTVKAPEIIKLISLINPFNWFVEGIKASININPTLWFKSISFMLVFFLIALAISLKTFKYSE
jgi:ABC-2 type transport system permease protein